MKPIFDSPGRNAVVSLREVTPDNLEQIIGLQVAPDQEVFVEPNAVSLAEAFLHKAHTWVRAIYADERPVGFLMLKSSPEPAVYGLWRLMVDYRFQGAAFGSRAVEQVIEHVRKQPGARRISLFCIPQDGHPGPFYERLGFVYTTGEVEEGELRMHLDL
ncbi:GNAT family N-acetyltransferase [Chitinimonas lacunae]|uniref:GNAT family N-acetyltransferase n=1 Tax=Chitinimonas lacunae TaxID=1963018 RepID=A0ABV8MMY0_9NEIS